MAFVLTWLVCVLLPIHPHFLTCLLHNIWLRWPGFIILLFPSASVRLFLWPCHASDVASSQHPLWLGVAPGSLDVDIVIQKQPTHWVCLDHGGSCQLTVWVLSILLSRCWMAVSKSCMSARSQSAMHWSVYPEEAPGIVFAIQKPFKEYLNA